MVATSIAWWRAAGKKWRPAFSLDLSLTDDGFCHLCVRCCCGWFLSPIVYLLMTSRCWFSFPLHFGTGFCHGLKTWIVSRIPASVCPQLVPVSNSFLSPVGAKFCHLSLASRSPSFTRPLPPHPLGPVAFCVAFHSLTLRGRSTPRSSRSIAHVPIKFGLHAQ